MLGHFYTLLSILGQTPESPLLSLAHFDALRDKIEDALVDPTLATKDELRKNLHSFKDALK
jgi:hypothetical protein